MPADQRPSGTDALSILAHGEIELQGRMPWSSNGTFLALVALDGVSLQAVYKPFRGERPLWDFPDGLYQREVAAYQLSCALGWQLVPETVLRDEAPLGLGSAVASSGGGGGAIDEITLSVLGSLGVARLMFVRAVRRRPVEATPARQHACS